LTYIFLISAQLEAHSSSRRVTCKLRTTICPSDFCRCILSVFYYTKVVFSPPRILTFLCPLRWYNRTTQDKRLVHPTQLASNYLVASARGHTETWASYLYQQLFSCLENGSGRNTQQLFCCRNKKVASARALI
jgi:hypothetical protein